MTSLSQETVRYVVYAAFNVIVAREVNAVVTEPYMVSAFSVNRGYVSILPKG